MSNLAKKLRITPGVRVLTLGAPASFDILLDPLPEKASLSVRANGKFDVVMLFVADAQSLEKGLPRAIAALEGEGIFWICYPKKTSAIKSDLTRDIGWKAVTDAGLGAVTQVAIDETWSALRFKDESKIERKEGSVVAPVAHGAAKKAPAPKKAITTSSDLVNALGKNDAASATWKTLAPSHVKEYVTWIEDAKRPETRARRIEQAVTMLADGVRDRNAKYAGR